MLENVAGSCPCSESRVSTLIGFGRVRAEVAKAYSQRYEELEIVVPTIRYREEIETVVIAHGARSGIMSTYRYRTGVTMYVMLPQFP